MTADPIERSTEIDRGTDRRHGGRGGRRNTDRGRPWWQKGLVFAALCAALRLRRHFVWRSANSYSFRCG